MGKIVSSLNRQLHPILLRYLDWSYRKKNRRVRSVHPELYEENSSINIRAYCDYWRQLTPSGRVDPSWYIMHSNLSGVEDLRYVPENLYFAYIEPVLNEMDASPFVSDKNLLHQFVPVENIPRTVLRYMKGSFYDDKFRLIDKQTAQELLDENDELVIKPSVDSSGGAGVALYQQRSSNPLTIDSILRRGGAAQVVQRKIRQHAQSAVFNAKSINTCRVMTLRCPWNGETVLLKSMLRIGRGDVICDNMMMGGVCLGIRDDGCLSKYAYDYNGQRYESLPGTDIVFGNAALPLYPKMVGQALLWASRIPYMHILSFDLVADENENVVCLEVNTAGQGITQLQYDGVPLFKEHTDEVVDWCRTHQDLNSQRHLKTFYW